MIARFSTLPLLAALLLSCAPHPPVLPETKPTSVETTATFMALRDLPGPKQPVPVAVYNYPDLTGQFKASETVSTSSRAVTQGAVWMLVKSLKDAADGGWFKVIQRANLDYLLKERQIIRETRGRVAKQTGQPQPGLPSLLFAGLILDGGIIGYDSNTVTGGLGARYLGIGGDVQYRQDTVTVYLNAISSQTGEIVKSVMTRKTVVSYGVRGSVFKFVAFQKLLEGEAGYTVNEPGQIALAQAIEHAVRALIIEGADEGLWQFADAKAGQIASELYLADKDEDVLLAAASADPTKTPSQADLERLIAKQKAKRKQILARKDAMHERLAEAIIPTPAPVLAPAPVPVPAPEPDSMPTPILKKPVNATAVHKLSSGFEPVEPSSALKPEKVVSAPAADGFSNGFEPVEHVPALTPEKAASAPAPVVPSDPNAHPDPLALLKQP